jgi:hypothetical protein
VGDHAAEQQNRGHTGQAFQSLVQILNGGGVDAADIGHQVGDLANGLIMGQLSQLD